MIKKLCLTDFRNHTMCKIETHGCNNVIITGPNGAGKTAILEALSILSGDRGMRGAQYVDVARFDGNGGFSVFAVLDDDTEMSVAFNSGDTNRHGNIDGDTATLVELSSRLPMVWITPREDRLFVDAASERRAFFDRLVASFDSNHSGRVARFTKLLSERAIALKSGRDMRWVDALDDQIAGVATAIAAAAAFDAALGGDVFGDDLRMQSASGRKFGGYFDVSGLHGRDHVVENLIGQPFVENAFVAIRLQVEFQAFEFDAQLVGDVLERNRSVVGLSGFRAQRREFRTHVRDEIVAIRIRIVERFKYLGRRLFGNDVWH